MDSAAPKRNPLFPVLIGFLVVGFFDIRFYFIEHHFVALGSAIVGPIAIFIVLFFTRSRLAWLTAVIIVPIIALTLFLTYQLGYMGFPLTRLLAIVDVMLFGLFLVYVLNIRGRYFRYLGTKEA